MLSRRNLRVKVMQVLFAIEHSNAVTAAEAIRILERNIEKSYRLLAFSFSLIARVADQIQRDGELKSGKLLPSEEDLQFSTKLTGNSLINALRGNKKVAAQLKLFMAEEEDLLVKSIFKKLTEQPEYHLYCTKNETALKDEREIILLLYNKAIAKNPAYLQYAEDNYPECVNDMGKIQFAGDELLQKLAPENADALLDFPDNDAEEVFAKELLEKTMENNERFTTLIQPKLKNWDVDRIARMDMVLMKMALCELLCFEQIPVKVSINEYIDISKVFSTPRSKDFINGILDNVMHDLREKNEIRKTGRGLVE